MSKKSITFAPDLENNKFNQLKTKHYDTANEYFQFGKPL